MTNQSGETKHFVITQDLYWAEIVSVPPGQNNFRSFMVPAGTGTYRLLPKGWCKIFNRDQFDAASQLRDAAQQQVDFISQTRIAHEQTRSIIDTLASSLIVAITENKSSTIRSLQTQIGQLEENDNSTLGSISGAQGSIDQAFQKPFDVDAAIVELNLHPFDVDSLREKEGRKYLFVDDIAEISPGMVTWVNDDRDDRNSSGPDNASPEVREEKDLTQVWWFYATTLQPPRGISNWNLLLETVSPRYKFWKRVTKVEEDPFPKQVTALHSRERVFVEALQPSLSEGIEIILGRMEGDPSCIDQIQGTNVAIEYVDFEAGSNNTNSFDTRDAGKSFTFIDPESDVIEGGERRLFPDLLAPDDPVDHTKIDIRVTITPKRANTRVWAKSFDVADPLGPEVSPITRDKDNRLTIGIGFEEGVLRTSGGVLQNADGCVNDTTDTDGEVVFRLDTSTVIQPGNNFRIVAGPSCAGITEDLFVLHPDPTSRIYNGSMQKQGPPLPIVRTEVSNRKQSPLLILWRRWHLEVDSTNGPGLSVNIAQATISGFSATRITVELDPASIVNGTIPGASLLDAIPRTSGRFQGGSIFNINRDEERAITQNTATMVFLSAGAPAAWAVGDQVLIFDDDRHSAITRPDTTLLKDSDLIDDNRLAICYIRPTYDGGGDPANDSDQVVFRMNYTTTGRNDALVLKTFFQELLVPSLGAGSARWNSFTKNSNTFWTGYLLGAFQPGRPEDADPDGERPAGLGFTAGGQGPGSAIFGETIRDVVARENAAGNPLTREVVERSTVVHEIAHQLNAAHGDGGVMGDNRGRAPYTETKYTVDSQRKMRDTAMPGKLLK